ncbi:putative lipoprotein YiaD precursor [bacterium BMS3Abin04]|nr:putative lipoprotein YiaD precursor [bacterium BMS3Abin04]
MLIKKTIFVFLGLIILCSTTNAQFDNLLKKAKEKVKRKVEREIDKGMNKGIDEADKAVKEGASGKKESGEQKGNNSSSNNKEITNNNTNSTGEVENKQELTVWSKYNFVPGDKIIFEDNLISEENGEFPSRWDLTAGNAENAMLGNDNIINFNRDGTIIKPLMEKESYLPEVFTLEFDAYFDKESPLRTQRYEVRFFEGRGYNRTIKNSRKRKYSIGIYWNKVQMNVFGDEIKKSYQEKKAWHGGWKHVAIAFNKRSLKLFVNQNRLLNIPKLGYMPQKFSIGADFDKRYINVAAIKNIRLAEGGKKLYDRIMADGKFVTRGILFDVNKADVKPESMGVINKIVKLMKKHPDLKFRIEGHTDSDGDEVFNLALSGKRAKAVMDLLIDNGIDASRFESKGYGENKPVDNNTTPEGKANNRRVEFIKI